MTILVLVTAMACCGEAASDGPVPVVLADVAHAAAVDERTVLDHGPSGFSRLWKAFERSARKTRINRDSFSPAALSQADVVLITAIAPGKPLTAEESSALKARIKAGATLLLTDNDLSHRAPGNSGVQPFRSRTL